MEKIISKNPSAVAEGFAAWLAERIVPGKAFHLALSGGSTPKILFAHLAEHYQNKISWADLHLWWGDERCVPPDHADSNYRMTKELLIDHVGIPSENVHRVIGEADPTEEAQRYGAEIDRIIPQKVGLAAFDLIMLGMGSDGHTASIFPHQMELLESKETCVVATHPESGQIRVSLSGPVINNADAVAFLVTGTSKTEKVEAIFSGSEESKIYPAAHIAPRGELFWFLDEAASA
ncbi:MAG: 6-phosphogluconolactonase [Bacteroidota bacterium]